MRSNSHRLRKVVLLACLLLWGAFRPSAVASDQPASSPGLSSILQYISAGWDNLTRSMSDCSSVVDPKLKQAPVLYLPAGLPVPPAVQKLHTDCKVDIEHLPKVIHQLGEIDLSTLPTHGLLYLPNKYVVPGGRFNEMYGWDSYFIILGLLREGRVDLARGMVENFFFEVEHYGAVLNANRTYYLTRSQPPFLSSMVLAVYQADKKAGRSGRDWLEHAYPYLAKDYSMWTREPHLAGSTGLSRYYDFGDGPPPEAVQDENVYRKVINYFVFHPEDADHYLVGEKGGIVCDTPMSTASPECEPPPFHLSADYYKGDRAMRESGFDISFRFGPYGAATHHYAPDCLNSLLYKTEMDMEQITEELEKKSEAKVWKDRADARRQRIQQYLWDQKAGFFFDYQFEAGTRSTYRYLTTFYPLWTGLATPEQAVAEEKNVNVFEQPGGLAMSTVKSGAQWDYPYGWAPVELLAIEGLRHYGFNADADRISYKFLSMVLENFQRDHTIREKYNVVTRSSESPVEVGYQQNVIGFGWTNAAFLELLHDLPKNEVDRLERDAATTQPAH